MTRREIAALAFKILGLNFVVNALAVMAMALGPLFKGGYGNMDALGYLLAPMVILVIFGVVLWRRAGRLAARAVPDTQVPPAASRPSVEDLYAIAFSVVGALVLVASLLHTSVALGQFFRFHIFVRPNADVGRWLTDLRLSQVVTFAVEGLIGLWLLLKPQGLARMLLKIRGATPEPRQVGAAPEGEHSPDGTVPKDGSRS